MIGYVTLGTNDLARGARFYDALAAEMGQGRMIDCDSFVAWGDPCGKPGLGLTRPHNGQQASIGNGTMVALEVASQALVNRLHAIALAHGGSDEGAPGARGEGFYAAYFRDPDGNKLNAFCTPV